MPGRLRPVDRRHGLSLCVPTVRGVVASAVAQVDATEVGDVQLGPVVVAQDDKFLVVRPADSHSHVEQALATGVIDLIAQMPVLRRGERQAVPMGAPYKAANVNAASGRIGQDLPDARARAAGETLIRVTSPVDEHQKVAVAHVRHPVMELCEVRPPVDERTHPVALGPRRPVAMTGVQPGRGVTAFAGGQEPVRSCHTRR